MADLNSTRMNGQSVEILGAVVSLYGRGHVDVCGFGLPVGYEFVVRLAVREVHIVEADAAEAVEQSGGNLLETCLEIDRLTGDLPK